MAIFGNMRLCSLILVLAVLLTFAGGWTSKAEGSRLVDLGEAQWARQAIAEMVAGGVVAGYPGAVYKPYNNLTKLEAVTMLVRMLGLEDQARATEEDVVDYRMPSDLNWGRGYLIMAVDLGMLDGDYLYLLQPNFPASRTEVAMLAFHALKFKPESGAMEFDDADQIPGEYRDGVAAIVKNGIMQGLPGNVFKPNDNINRAQMAVLMSNIVELKYADPCPNRRAGGIISGIDPAGRLIKIKDVGSIFYIDDCEIFNNEVNITPGGLRVGDYAQLILDENLHAVYINARPQDDGQKYRGTVNSILAIDGQYWLGIACDDGREITRPVADGVKIGKTGGSVDVSALSKGEYIETQILDNKITVIDYLASPSILIGEIMELNTRGTLRITIRDDEGENVKYVVLDDVEVARGDYGIDFDDLNIGERVRLKLNSRDRICFIEVIQEYSVIEGTVIDFITNSSPKMIRIRKNSGGRTQYNIARNADYYRDGKSVRSGDIVIGAEVKIRENDDNEVTRIEITNDKDITLVGTIIYVNKSDNKIKIEQVSGYRFIYNFVHAPVLADKDGYRIKLIDIDDDSEVKIILKDGKISSLTVLD